MWRRRKGGEPLPLKKPLFFLSLPSVFSGLGKLWAETKTRNRNRGVGQRDLDRGLYKEHPYTSNTFWHKPCHEVLWLERGRRRGGVRGSIYFSLFAIIISTHAIILFAVLFRPLSSHVSLGPVLGPHYSVLPCTDASNSDPSPSRGPDKQTDKNRRERYKGSKHSPFHLFIFPWRSLETIVV